MSYFSNWLRPVRNITVPFNADLAEIERHLYAIKVYGVSIDGVFSREEIAEAVQAVAAQHPRPARETMIYLRDGIDTETRRQFFEELGKIAHRKGQDART